MIAYIQNNELGSSVRTKLNSLIDLAGGIPNPVAVGDLLVGNGVDVNGSNQWTSLPAVASGSVLKSAGTGAAPAWGQVSLASDITGVLPLANGGSGLSSTTAGGILYGSTIIGATSFSQTGQGVNEFLVSSGSGVPYFESDSNLTWDSSNFRIGIGFNAPTSKIEIGNPGAAFTAAYGGDEGFKATISGTNSAIAFGAQSTTANSGFSGALAGLYQNSGTTIANGTRLGGFLFGGISSNATLYPTAGVFAYGEETWVSSTAHGTYLTFETVAAGSGTRNEKMRLSSAGYLGIGLTPAAPIDVLINSSSAGLATIHAKNSNTTGKSQVQVEGAGGDTLGMTFYGSTFSVSALAGKSALSSTVDLVLIGGGSSNTGTTGTVQLLSGGYDPATNLRMIIDKDGKVGIGTSSPLSKFDINLSGVTTTGFFSTPDICWSKQSATLFFEMGVTSSTAASDRPLVQGLRARGTFASKSAVVDGDYILSFNGAAHDGTSVVGCADMSILVDGTPATGKVPTKFVFSTHDNVTAGAPIERMRIDSTGRVGIGITPVYWLDVKSNAQISSRFDTSSGIQNRVQINHTSNVGIYLAIGGTNKWTVGATSAAFFFDNEAASKIVFALDTTTSAAAFGVYGSVPTFDASAQLQIDSTTKGFLQPRMTSAQRDAISTPSAGLMVYNTSAAGFSGYDGTGWGSVPIFRSAAIGTTTGAIALDFYGVKYQTVTLTGDPTFSTTNRAAGRFFSIKIAAGASSRTLAFEASWVWLGTDYSAGTTLSSGKSAILSLTAYGTTAADVVATLAIQP